jgi:hypothetical protein
LEEEKTEIVQHVSKNQDLSIKDMKYMGGSSTCILYRGSAQSNCAMKWLASAFITGSSVGMLHGGGTLEQQRLYSSSSVLATYVCVAVLPSHTRTDHILSSFFKIVNDVEESNIDYCLCKLLFV